MSESRRVYATVRNPPVAGRTIAAMNRHRVEGNWKQFSGRLKEQWGRFTRDPGLERAGKLDQIAGRALQRYGISKEQSERQLKAFQDRNRDWYPSNR